MMLVNRMVIFAVCFAMWFTSCDAAAIIGIDFGSKFFKVAFVQPGKAFDIVLNANTKRKTANMIGIEPNARRYDSDAVSLANRAPEYLFARPRDFLGVSSSSEQITHLAQNHGIRYELEEEEGTGLFKFVLDKGTENELKVRPEEIVAMILSSIKRMSSTYIENDVKDCVITVPASFTQAQRESLLNAAEIAGLDVLSLVDENVAAAVQHGVYNEFTNSSHYVLMYNMGASSTNVALFNFWGKPGVSKNAKPVTQIEVLAKSSDRTLGGDEFDAIMIDLLLASFEKEGDTEKVRDVPRAFERLRAQANKVKTVLSANNEIPVAIENLLNGRDLRTLVTRTQFETAAKPLFERVTKPIDEVLATSGIQIQDISAVEIIGGGVRVPRVKEILTDYFKDMELGSHLNGDEAMAFGSVFIGANMSKAFRVRPVGLTDITTDQVSVELVEFGSSVDNIEDIWRKDAALFNASSPLDTTRVVSFKRDTNVGCTLFRNTRVGKLPFANYEVTGVDQAIEKFGSFGKPKISLTFKLKHSDIVSLVKADAIFVEEIPAEEGYLDEEAQALADKEAEEAAAAAEAASATEDAGNSEEKTTEPEGEQATESDDESANDKTNSSDSDESDSDDKKSDKKKSTKADKKTKKPKGPRKKTHKFSLTIERPDKGVPLKTLSREQIQEGKELLAKYDNREEEQRLHEAAKNSLESFVFSSRDKIRSNEEEVDMVLSEENKEKLFDDLEALEDWIDDEGANAPISEYNSRRSEMSKTINRIFRRVAELDQRPATIRAAQRLISTIREEVDTTWAKERPWITAEEKATVLREVAKFEKWLNSAQAEQDALSLQEDPVLTAADIVANLESVQDVIELAFRRAPPRAPIQKKAKKEKKPAAAKAEKPSEEENKKDDDVNGNEDAFATDNDTEEAVNDASDEKEQVETDESEGEKDEL